MTAKPLNRLAAYVDPPFVQVGGSTNLRVGGAAQSRALVRVRRFGASDPIWEHGAIDVPVASIPSGSSALLRIPEPTTQMRTFHLMFKVRRLPRGTAVICDPDGVRSRVLALDARGRLLFGPRNDVAGAVVRESIYPGQWWRAVINCSATHTRVSTQAVGTRPANLARPPAEARLVSRFDVDIPDPWLVRELKLAQPRESTVEHDGLIGFEGRFDWLGVLAGWHEPAVATELLSDPKDSRVEAAWSGVGSEGAVDLDAIPDLSGNATAAVTSQYPTRGLPGHNWDGTTDSFVVAPHQYRAVEFHDDAVHDMGWPAAALLQVPVGTPPGAYEVDVQAANGEETSATFLVTSAERQADLCVVLPLTSYLAYANQHWKKEDHSTLELLAGRPPVIDDLQPAINTGDFGRSLYDTHDDGSPVYLASWRRPLLNWSSAAEHPLSCRWELHNDVHLLAWLEAESITFDLRVDWQLEQNPELFEGYPVLMTGGHPEYVSSVVRDTIEQHLDRGGRLIYPGGNGFYWVTACSADARGLIEIRRLGGTAPWESPPGERHIAMTGERGGLWKDRGLPPQQLVGVGFAAEGFDPQEAVYVRGPDAASPELSWIWSSTPTSETFGGGTSNGGSAASLEIDVYDVELGSPPEAYVIASSVGHSVAMMEARERHPAAIPGNDGTNWRVRSDVVMFATPEGGGVASFGSIGWIGGLGPDGDATVTALTRNVIERFLRPGPWLAPDVTDR